MTRGPDLVIINRKKITCRVVDFTVLADHRVKPQESKKKDKYLDLARELKNMEHGGDSDTNHSWCTWNVSQRFGKKAGRVGN